MNIKEAKEQIKNAMKAYFTKNEFGKYVIPVEKQRPVFLMGPPGIGKTAVMEQIAQELDVGLVSYSMTHHTRQSALGLPFIVKKSYGGQEYDVSEYTMSEIIASVYDMMEETGKKEGILFLDEINCVSETLAPSMLQFLQYKIFGRHQVPNGWIVVTAGNPPEYNNSVREFDIVTLDRLKRIDVEPDYDVWKEYAYKTGVHAAIMTYLDIKKGDFYDIETTVDGKSFVTARGWSDLSDMIRLYEKNDITVDEKLISQYLQSRRIARDFAVYYDLFNKYKSDYKIDQILAGNAPDKIKAQARKARFDERLSLLGLLMDGMSDELHEIYSEELVLSEVLTSIREMRMAAGGGSDITSAVQEQIDKKNQCIRTAEKASALSAEEEYTLRKAITILESQKELLMREGHGAAGDQPDARRSMEAFKLLKTDYDARVKALRQKAAEAGERLNNLFTFCEEVFADGQEMLILVTELTISYYGASFISKYGCSKYFEHNKELLFYERQKEIISQIQDLELE